MLIQFQIWGQQKLSFLLRIQIFLSYSWYFLFIYFWTQLYADTFKKLGKRLRQYLRLLLSDNASKFDCKANKKKQAFPLTMNQNFVTLTYLSMKTRLKGRVLLHSQTSQLLVIHKYRHKKVCSRGKTQGEVYIHWEWSKKNRKIQGCCKFGTGSFCVNVWSFVTVSVIKIYCCDCMCD